MSYTDFDFPHTHMYESDLREILAQMKQLQEIVKNFVNNNEVKFADPIEWNITTQYQKSTIVLDKNGNAFLSKQPVPSGIALDDEDYWLEIFNFMDYVKSFNSNLTFNVVSNTDRAPEALSVDDWLVWNDLLYKVTSAIAIDDTFIVKPTAGYNIERFTIEEFCRTWQTYMVNTINQYKNEIDASELAYKNEIDASELAYRNQLAQDIANTTASLQAQLNAAISGTTVDSEVINARVGADGITYPTLGDAIRTQFSNAITKYNLEFDMLGYGNTKFTQVSGVDHSAFRDTIALNVKAGDIFTVSAQSDGTDPVNVQIVEIYPDNTWTVIKTETFTGNANWTFRATTAIAQIGVRTYNVTDTANIYVFAQVSDSIFGKLDGINKNATKISAQDIEFYNILRPENFIKNRSYAYTVDSSPINDVRIYSGRNIFGTYEIADNTRVYIGFKTSTWFYLYIYDTDGILRKLQYIDTNFTDYLVAVTGYTAKYIGIVSPGNYGDFVITLRGYDIQNAFDGRYALPKLDPSTANFADEVDNFSAFAQFGVIGDSLACGTQTGSNGVIYSDVNLSWCKHASDICFNTMKHFAFAGATVKRWLADEAGCKTRLFNSANQCQCYIIGLGYNDRSYLESTDPLGTIADVNVSDYTQNANTFYGNYAKIIQMIKEAYPDAKIFCLTIPTDDSAHTSDINTAIRDIINLNFSNTYLIDLYAELYDWFYKFQKLDWQGAHYHTQTYYLVAKKIIGLISKYMYDHSQQFRYISEIEYH